MRYRRLVVLSVTVLAVAAPADVVSAPPGTIQVAVAPKGELVDSSARVSVRIRCTPFGQPLESNITVSQDDQTIFAQRGLPDVPCDNSWHTVTVVATPLEGSFHRGTAFASAFVSRFDPDTGETRQGQDARTIRLR
jgi:hypothetical protein